MALGHRRFTFVRYSPMLGRNSLALIYRIPPKRLVILNLSTLFPKLVVMCIAFGYGIYLVSEAWLAFQAKLESNSVLHPQIPTGRGLILLSSLSIGIFLNLASSYVTTLFTQKAFVPPPFSKDGDIILRLKSGEYQAFYHSKIFEEFFGNYFKKPGIFAPPEDNPDFAQRDSDPDAPLVWVGSSLASLLVEFVADNCDFDVYQDDSFSFVSFHLMYHPSFEDKLIRITSAEGAVAQKETDFLYHSRHIRHCANHKQDHVPHGLQFMQIKSAFFILFSVYGLALLLLLSEAGFEKTKLCPAFDVFGALSVV